MLTGDIIFVLAHIWGIAHLAGGCDVADHAFLANLQTETLAVHGTAVDAAHHHFSASFVVKIDAAFQQAEGMGYVVHDVVDELIEVENRADLLRSLLQLLQAFYLAVELRPRRGNSSNKFAGRGHGPTLQ